MKVIEDRSKKNNAKAFFLGCLAALLVGLIAIAGLVIYVDPFFHYHGPIEGFPYQIDNQTSQNPGMARNMTYDSVLIGSSMTVNFEAKWFEELFGENLIKLNYNGAYPKDVRNTMEQVDRSGQNISHVYLGVDLKSYSGDTEETKYPIPEYLHNRSILDDVNYWYNKDVILDYIIKPVIQHEAATDLSSVYNSEWWMKDYYSAEYVISNVDYIEKNDATFPEDMFVEGLDNNLEVNIIPILREHPDTSFTIFLPPYSALYWYEYVQNNQFDAAVREYRDFCEQVLREPNVRLFIFTGEEDIILNLDNYADTGHYSQAINRYMTECFESGKDEVNLMTYNDAIDHWAGIIRDYDYDEVISRK